MKWTVLWPQEAQDELTQIWLSTAHPSAVSEASDLVDDFLAHDPEDAGESRGLLDRVVFVDPIGVAFPVHPDDRRVDVLPVWTY